MNIEAEVRINAPVNRVFNAFYDFSCWESILPNILAVDVKYDDGSNQSFSMKVLKGDDTEVISGNRFSKINEWIEVFHTSPPPVFKKMIGKWFFKQIGDVTIVSASRDFSTMSKDYAEVLKVSNFLESFLNKNLILFKKYLEETNVN